MTTPNSDLENDQTDVESIDDSSLNASSVTRFTRSSITDFNFSEEDVQELLDSQFSTSTVEAPEETVQEWVNKSEEACGSNSQALSQTDFDPTPSEQIQKMAAALLDGIKNENEFSQEAWLQESEDDHQVPSGDVVKNFIEDTKLRLPSALMNLLNLIFREAPLSGLRCFYTEVLYCAAEQISGAGTCPPRKEFLNDANFEHLLRFRNGEYFTDLRLSFKQLPKHKQPIVRAVHDMVNESIVRAFDSKNAMLFSGYAMIPDIVEKCNTDRRLGYNPDQVATYGIRLQKAVYQQMTARCLDFLAFAGFKLKPIYLEAEGVYLSSNDSQISQPFSLSQCSQSQDDDDVQSTFSSQGSMPSYETESNASQGGNNAMDPALHDLRHSPGFQEYLRGSILPNGSPGGSWGSNYSDTPPQYSVPEQEPVLNDIENENGFHPEVLEHSSIQMDLGLSSLSSNQSVRSDSSDEGPRRRRPRLELE